MHSKEITLFDLDPKVKVTRNVAQYPQHHVTYAPAKFDVAHPMEKEKMHLQENTLFDLEVKVTLNVAQYPRHHVTYAPAKFDIATHPRVKEKMHLHKNTLFDLELWGQGHRKCCPVPSTSCTLCTYRV